jgi:glucose dehydrogenase
MDKATHERPTLTGRSVALGAAMGVVVAGLALLAAGFLVGTFRRTAAWVLPTVVIGVVAIGVVCAVLLLPLVSRRRPI